uniref:Laminin N-terminal domain-containing protein n=1 Tax=Globodera pallida TaxID=36090 RepID=A0A183CB20_GLOPA
MCPSDWTWILKIPIGPPKSGSDVICINKYSGAEPSFGGEFIYTVSSPHIPSGEDDAYALLKITNLRINFTKLHTLGNDGELLKEANRRPEIEKKYWYAHDELVVGGSCSCYGHAQRCAPHKANIPGMVDGRCECTHNTKGPNCEQCQANYCTGLAQNISSAIQRIPINAPGFQVGVELPARLIEARKFVKALVRKTDRINNMPRDVALANNNNDVNVLLHRAREIVAECVCTEEALVEDFEKLLEFLLDFYHLITYQYLATVV